MLWDKIQGQEEAVNYLRQSVRKGKVVSAYLFQGPEGVGKTLTATILAQALNCQEGSGRACGRCQTCRAIENGSHPDVLCLAPTGKSRSITIDRIREMQKSAHLHAQRGNWKVFIVKEAGAMNEEAQNSLLKTLEEPPGKTVLILITPRPEKLLPTIRSRCQKIAFKPWPFDIMKAFLKERAGLESDKAYVIHCISGGRPGRALRVTEEGFFETRRLVLQSLQKSPFPSARKMFDQVQAWLEHLAQKSRALSSALEKRRADWGRDFEPGQLQAWKERDEAEVAAEERAELETVFELIFSWFRDLFIFKKTGREQHIINQDLKAEVASCSRLWNASQLLRMMLWVEKSREVALTTSIRSTHQLIFENLFIQLGYWQPPR